MSNFFRPRRASLGLVILLLLISVLFTPVLVHAEGYVQTQLNAAAGASGAGYGQAKDPRAIIATVVEVSLGFVGVLFVVYLVYGGYLILLSKGEEEKIKKGRNIIMYGVIGLFIILSAYSITLFVDRYMKRAQGLEETKTWTTMDDTSQMMNSDPLNEPNPAGPNAWESTDWSKW